MRKGLYFWPLCFAVAALTGCSDDTSASHTTTPDVPDIPVVEDHEFIEVSSIPDTGLITDENGKSDSFEVKLKKAPEGSVTVRIASDDPSEGMSETSSISFDSSNWDKPQTVTIKGVDDDEIDGDISYHIILVYVDKDDTAGTGKYVNCINKDNDKAGLKASSDSLELKAGEEDTLSLTLTAKPSSDVTLSVSTSNPDVCKLSADSIVITPDKWNEPAAVTVTALTDGTCTVSIGNPSTNDDHFKQDVDASISVNVTPKDSNAGIELSTQTVTVDENGSNTIDITLSSQPTADVTITFTSSNTDEGTVTSSVTFTPDNWNKPQTITIQGVEDNLFDGDANYQITGTITTDDPEYKALDAITIDVTSKDTTTAGVKIDPKDGLMTSEDALTTTFSVSLISKPEANVTLTLASSNEAEGTIDISELIFTPDNWNIPQSVTITGQNDDEKDGDIQYTIDFANAVSDDPHYSNLPLDKLTVTNLDNDTAGVFISKTSLTTSEDGTSDTFDIILKTKPDSDVTITFQIGNDKEGKLDIASVTFTPDNWNVAQTITVTGLDDDASDGDIAYDITFNEVTCGDRNYNGIKLDAVHVTNTDNDHAGVAFAEGTVGKTSENGDEITLGVVLTARPSNSVTVQFASDDNTEGLVTSEKITFTASNWNKPQNVTVKGVDDDIADGDIAYHLVAEITSKDAAYNGIEPELNMINLDNEIAAVNVTPTTIYLNNGYLTSTVDVVLNAKPMGDVTMPVSSADTAHFTIDKNTLTFTETDWNVPQTITATLVQAADSPSTPINTSITIGAVTSAKCAAYDKLDPNDVAVVITKFENLNLEYKGEHEELTLYPGKYKLEVWGASGGDSVNNDQTKPSRGGLGGYASGVLSLDQPVKTVVVVGGRGTRGYRGYCSGEGCDGTYCATGTCTYKSAHQDIVGPGKGGGYNGGGSSTVWTNGSDTSGVEGYGGGGATDIRLVEDSLYARVIVAGGGGGGDNPGGSLNGSDDGRGGYGGGETAGCGYHTGVLYCTANAPGYSVSTMPNTFTKDHVVTQIHGFAFGQGEHARYVNDEGGGGGGWFGGFRGDHNNAGGTGGSGFVFTKAAVDNGVTAQSVIGGKWLLDEKYYLTETQNIGGNQSFKSPSGSNETGHSGNGYAKITLITE